MSGQRRGTTKQYYRKRIAATARHWRLYRDLMRNRCGCTGCTTNIVGIRRILISCVNEIRTLSRCWE